jgi:hypothetical protein
MIELIFLLIVLLIFQIGVYFWVNWIWLIVRKLEKKSEVPT